MLFTWHPVPPFVVGGDANNGKMSASEFPEFQNRQNRHSENSPILKILILTKKKKKLTLHRLGRVARGEKPKERNTKHGGKTTVQHE